jgi:hypothetical protein
VVVRCGSSGVLRTTFTITSAETSITLETAARLVCERAPARALSRYKTQLIPLLERTIASLRQQYGAFDCAFGSNYYKNGGPISYYLISVRRGPAPCRYVVAARLIWISGAPLPGYDGPKTERYSETCSSLRG